MGSSESSCDACYEGDSKIRIMHGRSNYNSMTEYDECDEITKYETRACRILHGSYSWLVKGIKSAATLGMADDIDHWWINIETKGGKYYHLQFQCFDLIELRECSSSHSCDMTGLAHAGKTEDSSVWTEKKFSKTFDDNNDKNGKYKMSDVARWLESREFSPHYKMCTHNCQDLCRAFLKRF